ncbi:hypothetical protein NE865_08468 [Phthorimaea operculella]|nr:hypothetical protein NE865_08468 [Phthorimaea operculella]
MENTEPSTSGAVMSPRKKRKSAHLSATEKTMVHNVFKYVFNENEKNLDTQLGEKPNKRQCAQESADILGIGTTTVFNVLRNIKENITPTPPKHSGPKLTFKDKLDEFTFSAIRRKVHSFFYNNEAPTVAKVTDAVNDDPDLPNFSRSTMRLVLKHLNFKYASRKRRSSLIDRQDIILWRKKYLLAIKEYRRQGKIIYYQDETWVNEGLAIVKEL